MGNRLSSHEYLLQFAVDPCLYDVLNHSLQAEYAQKADIAILFSSHITEDMNKIADKLIFLNNGRILDESTIDEIREKGCGIDEYLEQLINSEVSRYDKNN